MGDEPVTIELAINQGVDCLTSGVENPRFESRLLLSHCLKKSQSYLLTWPEQILSTEVSQHYKQLTIRRAQGEPIAYLLGEKEFWSLPLKVTKDTLIPRSETELLVELGIGFAKAGSKIADLGTGSGAIALALASELPDCDISATDYSVAALDVAIFNANHLKLNNVSFFQGNWGEPLDAQKFDLILSNPPYVEVCDPHLTQGDLRFEPVQALTAEDEGLADIKVITRFAKTALNPQGWLLMEHGYNQSQKVQQILKQYQFDKIKTWTDLAGVDRVTGGQKSDQIQSTT